VPAAAAAVAAAGVAAVAGPSKTLCWMLFQMVLCAAAVPCWLLGARGLQELGAAECWSWPPATTPAALLLHHLLLLLQLCWWRYVAVVWSANAV
jgi:hypothetical protein